MNTSSLHKIRSIKSLKSPKAFLCLLIMLFLNILYVNKVYSLPQDYEVVSGTAEFNKVDNILTINASDKAIVNYKSFDIAANERVIINLPDINSQILNRVNSDNATNIFGTITCNGVFILVNQSGIYIAPTANITSHGVILSTRDITNQNFLDGKLIFQKIGQRDLDKLLLNEGHINITNGGFGVLIAGAVENRGIITAKCGTIAIAGGNYVTLQMTGNSLISIAIEESVASTITDYSGNPVTDQIKNTGTLDAEGGTIILNASSINDIFTKAINLQGVVRANRFEDNDGAVKLIADGEVSISADISATDINIGPDLSGIALNSIAVELQSKKDAPSSVTIEAIANMRAEDLIQITSKNSINVESTIAAPTVRLVSGNDVTTKDSAIIQATNLSITANRFGSSVTPLNLDASNIYIRRLSGDIDIRQSQGIGTSVQILGPPDDGFGQILYNHSAHLYLEADKIIVSTDSPITFLGNITFSSLYLISPNNTIFFEQGHTYTILNEFYVRGAYAELINLRSTQDGIEWYIDPRGARDIEFMSVKDSNNINSIEIVATKSNKETNCTNWDPTTTWKSTGSGNWSTGSNWDTGVAPPSGNDVLFNAGSGASTIDADWQGTCASLTIGGTYGGTITLGKNLTVTGDISIGSGALDALSYTIYAGGNWTKTGGTFTAGTGTVIFNSTTPGHTITSGGSSFYSVTFNGSGGGWTLQDNLTQSADGNFALTAGTLNLNGKIYRVTKDNYVTLGNGFALAIGSGELSTAGNLYLTVPTGTTVTLSTGFLGVGYLIVSGTGTFTVTGAATIAVAHDITITSANWTAGQSTLYQFYLYGNLSSTQPLYNYVVGSSSGSNFSMAVTLQNNLTVTNNFTIPLISGMTRSFNAGSYTINVGGNFSNSDTFTAGTGSIVIFNGTSTGHTITSGGSSFYNLTINGSGGYWTAMDNLDVNNNLTITTGTLDMSTYGLSVGSTTTIATSSSANATLNSSQRKVFFDTVYSKYWAFYYNGSSIEYAYSIDGSSWTTSSTISANTPYFSVTYKEIASNGYAFIAAEKTDTYDITLRRGTVSTSSISFGDPVTVFNGTGVADNYTRPTIALDSNNYVWVGAVHTISDTMANRYQANVIRSTNTGNVNISTWQTQTVVGMASDILTRDLILLPQSGSNMALLVNGTGSNIVAYTYNGSTWSDANAGGDYSWFNFPGQVFNSVIVAIAAPDATHIYVGGKFTNDQGGSTGLNYIAMWNGSAWSTVGNTGDINNIVWVISALDTTHVYVGGEFTNVAGVTGRNKIAMWNGSAWSTVGNTGDINDYVCAITIQDSTHVYVGGGFTNVAGVTGRNKIAMWNGSTWSNVGASNDLNAWVNSIAIQDSTHIYVGGAFTGAGGVTGRDYIAMWDGSSWNTVGSIYQINSTVTVIAIQDSTHVYVGGGFTNVAGITGRNYIAMWNGSAWSTVGNTGDINYVVADIAIQDATHIYIGGYFTNVAGVTGRDYIAMWDGSAWSTVGSSGAINDQVRAIHILDATHVYVGGNFNNAGGVTGRNKIAMWNGSNWSAVGTISDFNNSVYAIAVQDATHVYVGGTFTNLGGVTGLNRIAMWNGSSWNVVGDIHDISSGVYAIAIQDATHIYVGGVFTNVAGVTGRDYIAMWDGLTWNTVGAVNDINYIVRSIAIQDATHVYVGGSFTNVSGVTGRDYIAMWNGSAWNTVGNSGDINNSVRAISIQDATHVYVGGNFTNVAGESNRSYIAMWNGSAWNTVGHTNDINGGVYAISIQNSTHVFIGGDFINVAGVTGSNRIAMWSGSIWSMVGAANDINSTVYTIAIQDATHIYVGGVFTNVASVTGRDYIAMWNGSSWSTMGAVNEMNSDVRAIASLGTTLYVGGNFTSNSTFFAIYKPAAAANVGTSSQISAVADSSGDIHMIYTDASSHLQYRRYDSSDGLWGSVATISGNVSSSPTISIDNTGNKLASFWIEGSTIYGKGASIGTSSTTWNASTTSLYSTGTNANVSSMYSMNNLKTPIIWTNGVSDPYSVYSELITISPVGTLNVAGNFSNSGTFISGVTTVTFDGTATGKTVTSGGSSFYNLTINGSGGAWTIQDPLSVSNAFTLINGTLDQGTTTINMASYSQSGGTFTGGANTITDSGDFILLGGAFTSTSGTLYVSGDWSNATSTFINNHGTVILNGTGTFFTAYSTAFKNLSLAYANQTISMDGSTAISWPYIYHGTLTFNGGTINMISNMHTCVLEVIYGTLVFASPTSISINRIYYTYESADAGNMVVTSGDYGSARIVIESNSASAVIFNLGGDVTTTGGFCITNGNATGTLTFNTQNYSLTASYFKFGVDVAHYYPKGGATANFGSSIINLTGADGLAVVANGGYTPTYNVNLGSSVWHNAGNWITSDSGAILNITIGTFVITFDGTTTSTISGDNTFNNFTSTTAGKTIYFTAGSIQTINGALTLTGVVLRSTTSGSQWKINPKGAMAISGINIQDSYNMLGTYIFPYPTISIDNGNNSWWFTPKPIDIKEVTANIKGYENVTNPGDLVPPIVPQVPNQIRVDAMIAMSRDDLVNMEYD